jgi:predicted TIM-barrel fold metal-dependent hydrolase
LELIIDADTHVTEPADVWTSRVPRRYRDLVPHVVRDDAGWDIWVLGGIRIATVGSTAPAGWEDFPTTSPKVYADCHPAAYDSSERLKYMDQAGLWAQVLYPNVAGFGSQHFLNIADDELKLLCVRAYNDFLHEWASADPARLVTVCSLPFWDIGAAVTEAERCISMGFRGLLFTGEPQRFGCPVLGSHHWDPLWSVAQEANVPIHFHIGGGEDTINLIDEERLREHGKLGGAAHAAVNLFLKNGTQCLDLVTSGVLSRYPSLKFVSVESGIGWIPFALETADYTWLTMRPGRVRADNELLPSDYFRRQVYCTYWFERVAPRYLLESIPVDRILFETDFPHTVCLYGDIAGEIDTGLAGVPDEVRRKILWENAAELYGIRPPQIE